MSSLRNRKRRVRGSGTGSAPASAVVSAAASRVIRRPCGSVSTARTVPVTMAARLGRSRTTGARHVAAWPEKKPMPIASRHAAPARSIATRQPPASSATALRQNAAPDHATGSAASSKYVAAPQAMNSGNHRANRPRSRAAQCVAARTIRPDSAAHQKGRLTATGQPALASRATPHAQVACTPRR